MLYRYEKQTKKQNKTNKFISTRINKVKQVGATNFTWFSYGQDYN